MAIGSSDDRLKIVRNDSPKNHVVATRGEALKQVIALPREETTQHTASTDVSTDINAQREEEDATSIEDMIHYRPKLYP